MLAANEIEFGDENDGTPLEPTFDNDVLLFRQAQEYYGDMETPEETLGRVRTKLKTASGASQVIGQSIVETLATDGMNALTAEQLAWIPPYVPFSKRRAALELQVGAKLAGIEEAPAAIAADIDNTFQTLMDDGGRGKAPTTRKLLFRRLMEWLWGPEQPGEIAEQAATKCATNTGNRG